MRKLKKFLSALLAFAMIMSMVVLPVSAAQTYDYTLTENVAQEYTLKYGETAYFHFTVEETGWYLICGPESGMSFGWALYEAPEEDYSKYIEVEFWFDPTETYFGTAVYAEAGKTYTCKNESDSTSAVTNTLTLMKAQQYEHFKLDKTEASGLAGEQLDLSIDVGPQFAYEPITWTSSDPTVATRRGNTMETTGDIALLSPGTATITATTESGWSASCVVTVEGEAVERGPLDFTLTENVPQEYTLKYDETAYFHFTVEETGWYLICGPESGMNFGWALYEAPEEDYSKYIEVEFWFDPTETYFGTAIYAEAGKTYTCKNSCDSTSAVTNTLTLMKAQKYETFELNKTEATGAVGEDLLLSVDVGPQFAYEPITWTVSDPTVAARRENSMETTGDIALLAPGTATITATTESGWSASCVVTVEGESAEENSSDIITLGKPKELTLAEDEAASVTFTATESGRYIFYCADGGDLSMEARIKDGTDQYTPHKWENADGTLSGYAFYMVAGRTYSVTATNYGSSRTFRLTAVKAEDYTSLAFPQDTYTGRVDSIIRLKAMTDPEFASEELTWSSSDSSVVGIYDWDSLSQTVNLLAPGEATITLSTKDGRVSATCKITVTEKPVLRLGEGLELTVPQYKYDIMTFTPPEDGRYIFYTPGDTSYRTSAYEVDTYEDLEAMQWQNSDKTLSGYVFDMLGGHQYEVALSNDWQESDLITTLTVVKAEKYESIHLDQTEIVTRINSFHELKLISTPEFAYEEVTWTSSDPETVSVFSTSSMGAELFVKAGGTVTVTATTESGLSASCTVTTQPTSSFVLNETREIQLYADTPYTRLYFIAPESGTYSFYKNSQVSIAVTADDPNTGEEFDLDFYFKGNYHVADLELDAGQTVCFVLHYHEDTDTTLEVGVGQLGPVQEIRLSHTDIVVAPLSGVLLEQVLLPVVCNDEKITVTSSDELIAAYLETATEENYTCHLVATFEELGTALITVTSESGATATCKVTVMEPEDITEGTHTTPVLPAGGYLLYLFTPADSGTYTVSDASADSVLDMHVVNSSLRGESWSAGKTSGSKLALAAQQPAWVTVKNDSDTAQAFTITLGEGYHEHLPIFVPKQEPGYTTPGMEAHCACPCGALFLDDAGTMPATEEELLIPQLVPIEDARADIGHDVLLGAAETAEDGNITIPLADAGEIRSADLPASALAQVAAKDISLTLEMPVAAVTMDTAALANVAEKANNSSVRLEITELGEEDLSESHMAAIEELEQNLVYVFSADLIAKGQSIAAAENGGFGDGKVTVQIPVNLAADKYTVLYLADDGSIETVENTSYADGILTMELEHFSAYAIVQDTMLGDVDGNGRIQTNDAKLILQYIVKIVNDLDEGVADVDGNGRIQTNDAKLILQYIVKIISKFPAAK